jgi:hypothetical protein
MVSPECFGLVGEARHPVSMKCRHPGVAGRSRSAVANPVFTSSCELHRDERLSSSNFVSGVGFGPDTVIAAVLAGLGKHCPVSVSPNSALWASIQLREQSVREES